MKKIFLFVLTFLIFCTAGQAKIIDFHNCYLKGYKNWKNYSEKTNLEDLIYSVDTEARTVIRLYVWKDTSKRLQQVQKQWQERFESWEKSDLPKKEFIRDNPYPFNTPKYEKRIYDLEGIVGGIAMGSISTKLSDGTISLSNVNINLSSGMVEKISTFAGNSSVICKKMK